MQGLDGSSICQDRIDGQRTARGHREGALSAIDLASLDIAIMGDGQNLPTLDNLSFRCNTFQRYLSVLKELAVERAL